jgi:putative two-component system response regulator
MHLNMETSEQGKKPRKPAGNGALHPWNDLLQPIRRTSDANGTEGGVKGITQVEGIFFALAQAVEQRDRFTAFHCERLAFMSVAMGIVVGLDRVQLLTLYRGGYLHDIGKVGIPDSILFKPGRLDEQEWDVMRTHPTRGVEICRHLRSLAPVVPVIRHHHERWDGSGYPDGLSGEKIPLLARLLQVADIYDALTSPRPYKEGYSSAKALRMIREETARGWRDPWVVDLFFRLHRDVISKADQFVAGTDRNLEAMRAALSRLQSSSLERVGK